MSILRYFIIINIVTFVLNIIDFHLFQKQVSESGGAVKMDMGIKIPWIFNVLETFGGGFGALLAYFILDPKVSKETIVSRIYALWWTIVWGFILFSNYNIIIKNKFLNFYKYISSSQSATRLMFVWLIVNLISFFLFIFNDYLFEVVNKRIFKRKVLNTKLQWIAALFGTTGAYIAMDFFNKKIRDNSPDHIYKGFRFVPILFSTKIVLAILLVLITF